MKDCVDFECTYLMPADHDDADERHALAYADIDGYPLDENEEGTVICRIWLLKERNGTNPSYQIDWHENRYRKNTSVTELIAEVKNDLIECFKSIIDDVCHCAYEKYKLDWSTSHGRKEDLIKADPEEILKKIEYHSGDKEDTCDDYPDFCANKWKDETYIRNLLNKYEYTIWKRRDWF